MQKSQLTPARVLFPLGLGTALSLMGDATLYTVLPTHTAEAGIALTGVGLLLGINRAVRLLLNGPIGAACDHWPRRRLFVPALFLGALSTAVYAATEGFWPLLLGRLLWGLSWSAIWVSGAAIILDISNDQDRGRWSGWYHTWFFFGAASGALAGGVLTDWWGYRPTMWAGAALTALGGLVALLLLPETGQPQQPSSRPLKRPLPTSLYRNRGLWVVALVQWTYRFVIAGALLATMGLLVEKRLSLNGVLFGTATITGVLMAGRTLLSMLTAPLSGTLSDRWGGRWRVGVMSSVVGALGMALLTWNHPAAILLGMILGALAGGGIQTLVTALTGDLVETGQRGRAIGWIQTVGDLGSALGPPVAYALLPWTGLSGLYLLCALLLLPQCVLLQRFSRHRI